VKRGVLVLIATTLLAASGTAATGRPTLALADRDPVVISLSGFRSHELVKVTLQDTSGASKNVLTTRGGWALARFRYQSRAPCDAVRAVATGNKGSRARMTVPDLGCPPIVP
jgi:hypothetical protein